jgi:hypothetical protein
MNRFLKSSLLAAFLTAAFLVNAAWADEPRYKAVTTVTIAGKPVVRSKATLANNVVTYEITASLPTAAGTVARVSCSGSGDAKEPIVYSFIRDGKPYGFTVVFSPLAADETL